MYTDGALGGKNEKPEYFRLEQLQEEFDFCTDDELNSNKRFRLLEYRSQEVPDFRNYRMVPIVEQEIRNDFFDVSFDQVDLMNAPIFGRTNEQGFPRLPKYIRKASVEGYMEQRSLHF